MQKQKVTVARMTADDTKFVSHIEKVCFGNKWTPTSFDRELDNKNTFYFVAWVDDKVVGYAGYWLILEEAHVTSVGVLPEYRRMGLSKLLMFALLDHCIEKDVKWVTLEVKEDNIAAQELYKKLGFKTLGRRKKYYQDDNKDAFIMWTDNITDQSYQSLIESLKKEIPN